MCMLIRYRIVFTKYRLAYIHLKSYSHHPTLCMSERMASMDQVAGSQGAAAAMFPFEDENDDLHWDEYGAALQPDEFQLKSASRPGQILFPGRSLAVSV